MSVLYTLRENGIVWGQLSDCAYVNGILVVTSIPRGLLSHIRRPLSKPSTLNIQSISRCWPHSQTGACRLRHILATSRSLDWFGSRLLPSTYFGHHNNVFKTWSLHNHPLPQRKHCECPDDPLVDLPTVMIFICIFLVQSFNTSLRARQHSWFKRSIPLLRRPFKLNETSDPWVTSLASSSRLLDFDAMLIITSLHAGPLLFTQSLQETHSRDRLRPPRAWSAPDEIK